MPNLFRYTAGAASCSVGLALLWIVVNVRPEHREWPEVDVLMAGIAFIIGAWYLLFGCGLLWMTSRNRYSTAPEFRRLAGGLYLSLLVLTMILTWIVTQIFTIVRLSMVEIIYMNLLLAGLIGAILLFLSTEVGNALAVRPRLRVTHLVFGVLIIAITLVWDLLSVEANILLLVALFVPVLFHFGVLAVTVRPQSRLYRILLDGGYLLFGVLIAILAFFLENWYAPTSRLMIIATLLLVVILPPYLGWLYLGAISADEVYAEEV